MIATFGNTVSILVKAYLNDELAHKTCSACAVGNIVAAAIGTKPKRSPEGSSIEFDNNFFDNGDPAHAGWYYTINGTSSSEGRYQIEKTGYSVKELQEIEHAFEHAPGDPTRKDGLFRGACIDPVWMFNGLMAVVDILADIHNVDLTHKKQAKELFVKV